MKIGKNSLETWLSALENWKTPGGAACEVVPVEPGSEIEFIESGSQTFGSGGYSASSLYVGTEPELLESRNKNTGFVSDRIVKIRMKPGSIIHTVQSDGIGGGRCWRRVYVCN